MLQAHAGSGGGDDSPVPQQIDIVLNWFEELKSRVPGAMLAR